jgi:type III secretory pathway component EscV
MSSRESHISVRLALDPPLLAGLDVVQGDPSRRVGAMLDEAIGALGVPAKVHVGLVANDPPVPYQPIRLFVDGLRCPFPQTLISDAMALVDRTERIPSDRQLISSLQSEETDVDGERLADILGWVCREAVAGEPTVLVGDPGGGSDGASEEQVTERAPEPIEVRVEPEYLRSITLDEDAGEVFPFLRDGLFVELGLPLPPFRLVPDAALPERGFAFRVNATTGLPRVGPAPDTALVNDAPEKLPSGVAAQPTLNPATYQPGALVALDTQDLLEAHGLTTWDALGYLTLCLAATLRRRGHLLMTPAVAEGMLERLGSVFPALVSRARELVPPGALAPLLRQLLLDRVSVRDLRMILELLLRFETIGRSDDDGDCVTFVRRGLAHQIAFTAARGTGTVVVYLLGPEVERAVAEESSDRSPRGVSDDVAERLSAALREEVHYLPDFVQLPAILTQDGLREPVARILRREFPGLTVLGYGDVLPRYNVQPVARIGWAQSST